MSGNNKRTTSGMKTLGLRATDGNYALKTNDLASLSAVAPHLRHAQKIGARGDLVLRDCSLLPLRLQYHRCYKTLKQALDIY